LSSTSSTSTAPASGCWCPTHPVQWQHQPTAQAYCTQRQRKFFHNLQQPEHSKGAEAYARFACRQLAATPGDLELVWMQEITQPPPLSPAPVQAVSRLRLRCS
jgi:hypothetical protein